jgi:4-amino-4-deoxy-L-arabinose transferase-like glycosyltransferase
VNAAVILVWGPSQTPLRIVNALAGAGSIAAAYWLAVLLFRSRGVARAASWMVLLSPSLFIWALTNLKERTLGLLVLVTLAAAVALVQRWTVPRWLLLLGAVFLLGELRHYYAAMIGWLSIAAFTVFSSLPVRRRNPRAVALLVSLGFVLQAVTGTFLATSMTEETVVRYVPLEPEAGLPSGYSPSGAISGRGETAALSWSGLLRSLWFVLVGGFEARTGTGRVFAAITWPEWLLNFALLPLVAWVSFSALRRRDIPVALVSVFVAGMILLLAWTYGDDWSTFRFRAVYWPAYLTLAAAGVVHLYTVWESRRSTALVQRLTP